MSGSHRKTRPMADRPARCLVRGSINIDEFFTLPHIVRPGETISSASFTRRAGGKGANQAFSVARAGGAVDLDGAVGTDGVWVREVLRDGGVGVDRVQVVQDEATGRAIIQLAEDGENSIVLHKGANFTLNHAPTFPNLSHYTHLLLQNEIPLSETLMHLSVGAAHPLTSIFNPSPMLSPDELRAFPWQHLSWLIVNRGELDDLLVALDLGRSTTAAGGEGGGGDGYREEKGKMLALREGKGLEELGVICTLGSEGVLYLPQGAEQPGHLPAGKVEGRVVDTTGAGDCFAGWFAVGMMQRRGVEESLKRCLLACAMCVERQGAMESVPSVAEVEQRLQRRA